MQHNLIVSREKLPWRPEEFLATKWLEAIVSGVVLFSILWLAGWYKSAVVLGGTVMVIYALLMPKTIRDRAKRRLSRIRNRLPFAVDLIALTMEAGGGFQECLATAVAENGKDHPLTEEFAEVLRQISLGRPRNEALQALQDRLHDDDVERNGVRDQQGRGARHAAERDPPRAGRADAAQALAARRKGGRRGPGQHRLSRHGRDDRLPAGRDRPDLLPPVLALF